MVEYSGGVKKLYSLLFCQDVFLRLELDSLFFYFSGMLFVLVAFGFLGSRKTNLNYRPGNTIIRPLIKRYPAAGQLYYLGRSFMLPGPVNDIDLATMRKGSCDLERKHLRAWQKDTNYRHTLFLFLD